MNDDLEHLVEQGLAGHADRLGTPPEGSVHDVLRRVGRRRDRRRRTAIGGSLAVVAVGVGGLLTLGGRQPAQFATASSPSSPASGSAPAEQAAWKCTDQLDYFDNDGGSYWVTCGQVAIDGAVPILNPPMASVEIDYPVPGDVCEETDEAGTRVTVPCVTPTTAPVLTGVVCEETDEAGTTPTVPCEFREVYTGSFLKVLVHEIVPGDSPSSIADLWGVPLDELEQYNRDNPMFEAPVPGGEVRVPLTGDLIREVADSSPLFDPLTDVLTPGEPVRMSLGVHCGVRVLSSKVNGLVWKSAEAQEFAAWGEPDWMPPEWTFGQAGLFVTLNLTPGGQNLIATQNGRSVIFDSHGSTYEDADLCE